MLVIVVRLVVVGCIVQALPDSLRNPGHRGDHMVCLVAGVEADLRPQTFASLANCRDCAVLVPLELYWTACSLFCRKGRSIPSWHGCYNLWFHPAWVLCSASYGRPHLSETSFRKWGESKQSFPPWCSALKLFEDRRTQLQVDPPPFGVEWWRLHWRFQKSILEKRPSSPW